MSQKKNFCFFVSYAFVFLTWKKVNFKLEKLKWLRFWSVFLATLPPPLHWGILDSQRSQALQPAWLPHPGDPAWFGPHLLLPQHVTLSGLLIPLLLTSITSGHLSLQNWLTHDGLFTSWSFICFCENLKNGAKTNSRNASEAKPSATLDLL